jgi:hypothetical protein
VEGITSVTNDDDNQDKLLWDEHCGHCTEAFEKWESTVTNLRNYVSCNVKWSKSYYEKLRTIAHSKSIGSSSNWDEIFLELTPGLLPHEYCNVLYSSVVTQSVTAFEIYLEEAAQEVLYPLGAEILPKNKAWDSPSWKELADFYKLIDIDINTEVIQRTRRLRHLVVHRQGNLKRDEDQREYSKNSEIRLFGSTANLDEATVEGVIEELDRYVLGLDEVCWRLAYLGDRNLRLEKAISSLTEY